MCDKEKLNYAKVRSGATAPDNQADANSSVVISAFPAAQNCKTHSTKNCQRKRGRLWNHRNHHIVDNELIAGSGTTVGKFIHLPRNLPGLARGDRAGIETAEVDAEMLQEVWRRQRDF